MTNEVITRAKEMLGLYEAMCNICEAAHGIECLDDWDSIPFSAYFNFESIDEIFDQLKALAARCFPFRPDSKDKDNIQKIIDNLEAVKVEYHKLSDNESSSPFCNYYLGIFKEKLIGLTQYKKACPMSFQPETSDGWMDIYWCTFDNLCNELIQRIVGRDFEYPDILLHGNILDILKVAITS